MIRTFLFLLLSVFGFEIVAQSVETDKIPRNYFRNPLDIPMQLSANFGELRPNHWHMGLDIRTNAKENLPVHAAAEGYIAKVGIRPQSFGRFIISNLMNFILMGYYNLLRYCCCACCKSQHIQAAFERICINTLYKFARRYIFNFVNQNYFPGNINQLHFYCSIFQ